MYFNYNTNGEKIKAFIDFDEKDENIVDIYSESGEDLDIETKLYNNKRGELCFKYNENEIKFREFVRCDIVELKKNIENKEKITPSQLLNALICAGVHDVRIGVSLNLIDFIIGDAIICKDDTLKCIGVLKLDNDSMPHSSNIIRISAAPESVGYGKTVSKEFTIAELMEAINAEEVVLLDININWKETNQHIMDYFEKIAGIEHPEYNMSL